MAPHPINPMRTVTGRKVVQWSPDPRKAPRGYDPDRDVDPAEAIVALKRKAAEEEAPVEHVPADVITGLPDRSNLVPWLEELSREAESRSERVALTFLEMGHFGDINDTYGPDVGDQVLAAIAQRLEAALQPNQRILRYYGAEFAVLTEGVATAERAHDVSASLLEVLGEPVPVGAAQVSVSTAAGVALSDSGYAGVREWLQDAHDALTEARARGNQSCVAHDESTRNRIDVRVNEGRVLKGWDAREFRLVYQPIVRTADRQVVGVEALLRWHDPGASGTYIYPHRFLPLLERTGLIVPVGAWVLEVACRQVHEWNAAFPQLAPLFVNVNLGARQIAQAAFAETVAKAVDAVHLPPELLVLDITEEALRYNKTGTWAALRDLKYLGIRLSLDDFGVGESSMSYLRDLQLDFLRIHKSFVDGLGQTKEDTAIVRNLINLGRDLGLTTVAEGVESDDQVEQIDQLGPDMAQGFFYSRPELPENLEPMLHGGVPGTGAKPA
jgi:diguanylate cyclase (GGDEF)-like protein